MNSFVEDFRRRFLRTGGGPFRHLPTMMSLSLLDFDVGESRLLVLGTLLEHFTRHDLQRLERYTDNKADVGLISDLIPQIASLYFQRRLGVHLSAMQGAVLLAMGIQNRSIDDLAKETDVPASQLMALFQKSLKKVWASCYALLSSEVEGEVAPA